MTKKLKSFFTNWKVWLAITIIASVWLGVKAAHTIDKESQYWTNAFWVSILFPVSLVFVQALGPYFLRKKMRWRIIFPAVIIILWIYDKNSITDNAPEFIWWIGLAFFIVTGFLIWEEPSTDNLFKKKK